MPRFPFAGTTPLVLAALLAACATPGPRDTAPTAASPAPEALTVVESYV
jgi:hypothetical protein